MKILISKTNPKTIPFVKLRTNQSIFQETLATLFPQLDPIDQYVFEIKLNEEVVGSLWLTYNADYGSWELLYVEIAEPHQRNGYARESLQQLLEFMVDEFGRAKCFAKIEAENEAMIHLIRSVGFFNSSRQEGTKIIYEKQL